MPLPEDVVADDPRYASEHPSHHNQIHAAINDLEALAGTLSDVETTTGSQGKVDTHALDTTSVHGISDTAQVPAKNAANTFTQTQTFDSNTHNKGPRPWVDVRAYGAVGDGTTNDAAAFQAAIDAITATVGFPPTTGGTLYIPPGVYAIGSTLNLKSYITYKGAGISSVLKHNASTNPLLQVAGSNTGALTIKDIQIQGGSGTGDGIKLAGTNAAIVTRVNIDRVYFQDLNGSSSSCVHGTWALETMISRCNMLGCDGMGVKLTSTSNAGVIRDCTMSNGGFGTSAIDVSGTPTESFVGVLIEGNVLESWRGSYGVRLDAVSNPRVIANHFENNGGDQLWIGSTVTGGFSHSALVANNHFSGGFGTTTNLRVAALSSTIMSNDFDAAVTLEALPDSTQANYTFIANHFATSGSLVDNTISSDTVAQLGTRVAGATGVTQGFKLKGPVGFYNTAPVTKPTVSGSRGANAALASLLTALASQGLITDSSS